MSYSNKKKTRVTLHAHTCKRTHACMYMYPFIHTHMYSVQVCTMTYKYVYYTHACTCIHTPGWKGAREYAQLRGISAVFRVITRQSRVFFSRVFAFSRPNTVRMRVISPIDGRETARKRSDNINTFYVLFAPAREFIRETA